MTILLANQAPTQTQPILNSSSGTNTTSENLTCYNQSTSDANGDAVKNIFNWKIKGTSALVLNMPFEGGSDSTWTKDYSGFGNNGSVTNATWNSTGGYDRKGAYEFDGVDDKIFVSHDDSLNVTELTVEAWINPSAFDDWSSVLIKTTTFSWDDGYGMAHYQGANDIHFFVNNYDVNNVTGNINLNEWSYVVGTYDGATIKLYINGALVDSKAYSTAISHSSTNMFIGQGWGSGGFWNGSIDELRIYNKSLSAEQIKALYNNQTNLIVPQETGSAGENWTCSVTPNDGSQDGTTLDSNNLTISAVTNQVPQITYVSSIANTDPLEASASSVIFYATVYDADGVSDINTSSVTANFTRSGEPTRGNLSCLNVSNIDANNINVSCTIGMWYWDEAGDWNVSVYAKDNVGLSAVNDSTYFQYNLLQAVTISPKIINFNVSSNAENQTAMNDPVVVNNTGNYNITGKLYLNAIDLLGERDSSEAIYVGNVSVGLSSGGSPPAECSGALMQNATDTNLAGAVLNRGNLSLGGGVAQEELYYCITKVGMISSQTYSTNAGGSWTIKIISAMVLVSVKARKKKKKKSGKRAVVVDDLSIPATIFIQGLGGLEALVKYLREQIGLTYHEVSELLNRNERTIWTAYNKSLEKYSSKIKVKHSLVHIPVSLFRDRDLTIFEGIVVYLKNKGMKYVEIGELLNRDQRNIWTIYNRARKIKEKIGNKEVVNDFVIPTSIFASKETALESIVVYLKSKLGMSYHEIALLLKRDDRTIWGIFNKSIQRNSFKIIRKDSFVYIPTSIFKNRKLTILESLVLYLKNKGMKYVEIGELLNRDQRNIWAIYNRARKK